MMYAVIESGGKQHRVAEGDVIKLESLDVAEGDTVEFDKVLMIAKGDEIKMGTPLIDGAKVRASVEANGRGKKIRVIKFRRRKDSRTQNGHRQNYTQVKIEAIEA